MITPPPMSFGEALKKLGIEDFQERIFNSNSHGELHHLIEYIELASLIKGDAKWFRPVFVAYVKWAEETWKRPESCFQHLHRMLTELLEDEAKRKADSEKPAKE